MILRSTIAMFLLAACGGREVEIAFEGVVGGAPARCGETYAPIGTSESELVLGDFRLYVHDLRLVTEDGRELEVALAEDGHFQHQNVALLDFEDGSAGCESGTEDTNAIVRGTVADEVFVGLRFRFGVPFELNHGDASTAPAPLSFTSMFWSWNGGYKFLRVDARTRGQPAGFLIHVGSTGCEGDGRGNVSSCVAENRAEIALDGFDPDRDVVRVDLARLLSESDVDVDLGGQPGCMGSFDDPDCAPIFHGLGLPFDGVPGEQRLFEVRE